MHVLRALVLVLALVGKAEALQHPVLGPALGFASLSQTSPGGQRSDASGVALELRHFARADAPRLTGSFHLAEGSNSTRTRTGACSSAR